MKKFLLSVAALAALWIGSSTVYAYDPYCQPNARGYGYRAGYGAPVPSSGLHIDYSAFYGPRFNFGYGFGYNPNAVYNSYRPNTAGRCACGQHHPHGGHCGHGHHNHRRW